ncbi:alpha-D-ribose 1-methylphosphonate 5-triphosphate synthase subunit PhnH [Cohaesibacter sp. ES.047]|uniref:phosphonate C-P lyase system protein PhnH n=1 Tax=Cohaesibacter sp. ES.047 TaxID=1798205 RepID=UPI000BB8B240|nr:phosphonate C-P lyase system protein PhnH [Cohaesibacter sp. ES.047]SNY92857.1 alpha-D-ribose 1-methylphosphonate 5-triphosphate synthase subunit PhnH [Cohaesibacter sp. ES.047]
MSVFSEIQTTGGVTQGAMQGGLGEPVLQSQRIFRVIMEAMARPGKIMPVATDAMPPLPLMPLAAAVLYTVSDADTPIWMDEPLAGEQSVADWLTFHVGCPIVQDPAFATFALISDAEGMPFLDVFSKGLQDYPDQSATLILQVESLKVSAGWELRGPGIKDRHALSVEPISPHFLDQWRANHALYPRGADVILVAPDAIACLPRTTTIAMPDPSGKEG